MDPELRDQELDAEIELLADVMDAVSSCAEVLSLEQIDRALRVDRPADRCPGSSSRQAHLSRRPV